MWLEYTLLAVVVGQMLLPTLNKMTADRGSLPRSLVWLYGFASTLCIAANIAMRASPQNYIWGYVWLVIGLGVFDAFAQYGYWRVIATPGGLSKASIFGQGEDVVAVVLGYIFLGEIRILTPLLGLGVVLLMGSVLFFNAAQQKKQSEREAPAPFSVWRLIAFNCLVWGVVHFAIRYLALDGMSPLTFLWAYYVGSFLGALGIYIKSSPIGRGPRLTRRQALNTLLIGAVLPASVGCVYLAKTYTPLTVFQPIFGLVGIIFPVVVLDLWWKNELSRLSKKGWAAIVFGLIGATIIALGY
jgi:drug/metabolite transporter (DMT)-like permease